MSNSAERPAARFIIKVDDLRGPEIAALLSEHVRGLAAISPPGSCHVLDLDRLRHPAITFWSVWDGPALAGCGALKQLDPTHGEIKSMRTAATHLRRGVATLVLSHILSQARHRGYRRISLETGAGRHFHAAHQLYERFGFRDSGPFADYRPDSNSRFMTLSL